MPLEACSHTFPLFPPLFIKTFFTCPNITCSSLLCVVTINTGTYHAVLDEYTMIPNEHCSMSEIKQQPKYMLRRMAVAIRSDM